MKNTEQLAIEHGIMDNIELYGVFKDNEMLLKARREALKKLEAFAKALQQPSYPVGFVSGGFEEQIKLGNLIAVSSEPYAHLTRAIYTKPPLTVSLEQYNKLLDALKLAKVTFIANKMDVRNVMEVINEAIAEAEGK